MRPLSLPLFLPLLLLLSACSPDSPAAPMLPNSPATVEAGPATPDWSKNANIYEVNIRQFTPEGTLTAFGQHLPRLAELGVDILWLMPVYPISEARRKGSLGSYYAVSDFRKVNPEFGTAADLTAVVDEAHRLGMRVILDFVPNHTGWDHHWITDHPDFYTQDADGNIVDPQDPDTGESYGWTDVADLNYGNPALRRAMIDDLRFLLETYNVDGFRMDIAFGAPDDYWEEASTELRELRPDIFLLAESEKPEHRNDGYFAANYGWSFHHLMNAVATGDTSAAAVIEWYANNQDLYQRGWHMHFITNHDENSWNGTVRERMGDNATNMAVLAFTLDGMPLIYGGQETGLDKRLAFFEKDVIPFADTSLTGFYRALLTLKHDNRALWNGAWGSRATFYPDLTTDESNQLAYSRTRDGETVLVLLNFGDTNWLVDIPESSPFCRWFREPLVNERTSTRLCSGGDKEPFLTVLPHGYRVYSTAESAPGK